MDELLKVEHLAISFQTDAGELEAVRDVSFSLRPGEVLAIVGESGCGKSVLCKSIMKLLPGKAKMKSGSIRINDTDISACKEKEMQKLRGRLFAMVFQDPMTSLNPTMTIGAQIAEAILVHQPKMKKEAVQKRVLELMETVGLAERLINTYPHELDGGRRQRIGIARALALNPRFIVCDEPVSALDVSIQAQILNLMQDLQKELDLTYMFITHDLSVVYHISDEIMVMYLGQVIEKAPTEKLFANPVHPYTQALLSAIPVPSIHNRRERILMTGELTSPIDPLPECRFANRCRFATGKCRESEPQLREIEPGHFVSCFLCEA